MDAGDAAADAAAMDAGEVATMDADTAALIKAAMAPSSAGGDLGTTNATNEVTQGMAVLFESWHFAINEAPSPGGTGGAATAEAETAALPTTNATFEETQGLVAFPWPFAINETPSPGARPPTHDSTGGGAGGGTGSAATAEAEAAALPEEEGAAMTGDKPPSPAGGGPPSRRRPSCSPARAAVAEVSEAPAGAEEPFAKAQAGSHGESGGEVSAKGASRRVRGKKGDSMAAPLPMAAQLPMAAPMQYSISQLRT